MKALPLVVLASLAAVAMSALAKFPPPSDEAKAKAAEAAAKTAHTGKVADFQLCKAMDKVAEGYRAAAKKAGKAASAPVATPPCADPGPFVYAPPAPASGAAAAAAASAPAAATTAKAAAPATPAPKK
ncbi:MAG: hypothetical protein RLZZ584_327 [Pseudomonadota bacterium]